MPDEPIVPNEIASSISPEMRTLIAKAARSILGVDRGEYCACAEPDSLGMVCAKCDRRIKAEEVRKVVEIVGCHEHVPGKMRGHMCKVCTMYPNSPRHNGRAEVGKTSWGDRVLPMREDAPNSDVSCWEVHA